MTAPGPDLDSDEHATADRRPAPFDVVPGLAEDFAAAGAAFVAACGGNAVVRLHGPAPANVAHFPRSGRVPP
jgi:hypothetical protein